jgi:succinate dehydrogenase / fumarate reductase cytochrome b subunit
VFHLSNGIWTAGITWGLWTTQAAQNRVLKFCDAFGIILAIVGLTAIWGFASKSQGEIDRLRAEEKTQNQHRFEAGQIDPNSPKIWHEETTTAEK